MIWSVWATDCTGTPDKPHVEEAEILERPSRESPKGGS